MRRLPMPDTRTQLTHGHSLSLLNGAPTECPIRAQTPGNGPMAESGESLTGQVKCSLHISHFPPLAGKPRQSR